MSFNSIVLEPYHLESYVVFHYKTRDIMVSCNMTQKIAGEACNWREKLSDMEYGRKLLSVRF